MGTTKTVVGHMADITVILFLGVLYVMLLSIGSLGAVCRRQAARTGSTVKTLLRQQRTGSAR